ncbi:hypothetical protein PTKIN_Ptkin08bG0083300 [Pterospermum kingtungense]
MVTCRFFGYLDLFLTFTCNIKWPEIQETLSLIPGQQPEDRPNIMSKVFKIKLRYFMDDLIKHRHLSCVIALTYTVEFQKHGLPHVHILLWLHPEVSVFLLLILIKLYELKYQIKFLIRWPIK